jgi:hypothetical protein
MEFTRESLGLFKLKGDRGLRELAKKKGIQLRKGAGKEEVITTILNYKPPPKVKRPAPPPPPGMPQVVADQEIKYRFAEGSAEEGLMLTRVERDLAKRRLRDINDARIAFEVAEANEQLNIRKIEMGVESDLKLMTPTGMNSAMEQARDAVAKARAIGRIRETKRREANRVFYDGKEIIFVSGDVPQEGDDDYEPPKPDYFNEAGQLSNERTEERARDSMNTLFLDSRDGKLKRLTEDLLGQAFEIVSTPGYDAEEAAEEARLDKEFFAKKAKKQQDWDRYVNELVEQGAMGKEDTRLKEASLKMKKPIAKDTRSIAERQAERVARYGSVFDKKREGTENMGVFGGNNPMAGFTSNDPYEQKIQQEKEDAMEMINYGRLIKRDRTQVTDIVAFNDRKAAWAEKQGAKIEEEKKRRELFKKQQAKKKRDAKKKK